MVFSTFDWDQWGKIRQLKNDLKLLKMQILNVMCWIAPQSRVILQTFFLMGGKFAPPFPQYKRL